jgi:hypothetical protein
VHPAHGVGELSRGRILQQVAGDAGIERAAQIAGARERGDDHDTAGEAALAHARRELEPGEPRHLDVGHDHVRGEALRLATGAGAVGAAREHLDVSLERQER